MGRPVEMEKKQKQPLPLVIMKFIEVVEKFTFFGSVVLMRQISLSGEHSLSQLAQESARACGPGGTARGVRGNCRALRKLQLPESHTGVTNRLL